MQQVNLYVPELRPQRLLLPGRHIGIALLALVVVLAAVQIYGKWMARRADADSQQWQSRLADVQSRYEKLSNSIAQMHVDENLRAQNQHLAAQLETRRSLLGSLQRGGSAAQAEQFSSVLEGLARQHINSVWLTGINISDSGRNLQLEGLVTQADQLPVYLQRLAAEPAFSGRQFNLFELQVPEDQKRDLSFRIGTEESADAMKVSGGRP